MTVRRAALAMGALLLCGAAALRGEPLRPLAPTPAPASPQAVRRVALGRRLFGFAPLSAGGRESCASCHDVGTSGASPRARDPGQGNGLIPLNTPTVFNALDNYRLNWSGRFADPAALVRATLHNPALMGPAPDLDAVRRDPALGPALAAAYGRGAGEAEVVDALVLYMRTLRTPGARFDRWLQGDAGALSGQEARGYERFKALGCAACHQGANVGGNLLQRHGVFHPLGPPEPVMMRVPSLRNVAATAPYFHDGSAPTLEAAVRAMGWTQLDMRLAPRDVSDVAAFLRTLTGRLDGRPVSPPATAPAPAAARP